MNKSCIFLTVLVALPLFAHPPKGLEMTYDYESNILSVEIAHSVNDAAKHFIKKVVVELNGKKIIEQTFKRQVDGETQQVMYKVIDGIEGDKITVTAYCNISGKKKADLTITMPSSDEASD
jgi:desulfoferrodoxin (superoxide reductase-like protein)